MGKGTSLSSVVQAQPQAMGGKGILGRVAQPTSQPQQPTQQEQAPQFMGGKGQPLGGNFRAEMPQQPRMSPFDSYRNFMGQMPYSPYARAFQADFQPPGQEVRSDVVPTQAATPQFDSATTQAEFDRARGVTPAMQPVQQMPQQRMMNPFGMSGAYGNGYGPYGPIGGGYGGGGGYSPFYGPSYSPPGGLGGLAALLQGNRFFNEGGEVK